MKKPNKFLNTLFHPVDAYREHKEDKEEAKEEAKEARKRRRDNLDAEALIVTSELADKLTAMKLTRLTR